MKTVIGKDRSLKLGKNNDELIIRDKGSKKEAVFTPARWASFRLCLDEIDNQLYRLSQGEDVAYCNHYGGGWHVSVTKRFHCIDLRKWWLPIGEMSCKPTKTDIALRLPNGQRSRRRSTNYIATTRPSPISHRASSSKTILVSRASPPAASAIRLLRPSRNRLSC